MADEGDRDLSGGDTSRRLRSEWNGDGFRPACALAVDDLLPPPARQVGDRARLEPAEGIEKPSTITVVADGEFHDGEVGRGGRVSRGQFL